MNAGRDVERLIADWFVEEAVLHAPDRVLEDTSRAVDRTKQRRFGVAWRDLPMSTLFRVAAAACLCLLAAGGALFILRPGAPGVGGPLPSVTSTPPSLVSPSPSSAVAGACDLLTADEAEQLAGTAGLGALPARSGSGTHTSCIFTNGAGDVVLRLEYTSVGGKAAFDQVRTTAGMVPVSGAGDAAIFDPATSKLFVLKGDAVVAVVATAINRPDRPQDIATAVGAVAAGRMQAMP